MNTGHEERTRAVIEHAKRAREQRIETRVSAVPKELADTIGALAELAGALRAFLQHDALYELSVRAAVHGDATAAEMLKPEADRRGVTVIELANEIQAARSAQIAAILAA